MILITLSSPVDPMLVVVSWRLALGVIVRQRPVIIRGESFVSARRAARTVGQMNEDDRRSGLKRKRKEMNREKALTVLQEMRLGPGALSWQCPRPTMRIP